MSRLLEQRRSTQHSAARHEFEVVLDPARPHAGLDPADLLDQVGTVARRLAARAAGGRALSTHSLEHLEVKAAVTGGERLVITAALESPSNDRFPVSVVARRADGPGLVATCVLVFRLEAGASSASDLLLEEHAPAAFQTHFNATRWGDDWLTSGNLVPWLHASSLLAAQGLRGGPVRLVGIEALSLVGALGLKEPVVLHCSAAFAPSGDVWVDSRIVRERDGVDVVSARSRWRTTTGALA
ncbi:MAG: hypothetical protein SFW67_18755 [Myxococcaceae bacterium]|nr:hypothetical protein [Myxococcaceae bacterium]